MKVFQAELAHLNDHHFGSIEWDKTWDKFRFKPKDGHSFDAGDTLDLSIIMFMLRVANAIIWWRYAPQRLWNSL